MVDASEKPLVTITGVTGFIGSMIAKYFLEDDSYRVRGTVRDKNNAIKMEPLRKTLGDELYNKIEIREANLLNPF